jgi:hypothetical protein
VQTDTAISAVPEAAAAEDAALDESAGNPT